MILGLQALKPIRFAASHLAMRCPFWNRHKSLWKSVWLLPKCNAMQKTHALTGCVNAPLYKSMENLPLHVETNKRYWINIKNVNIWKGRTTRVIALYYSQIANNLWPSLKDEIHSTKLMRWEGWGSMILWQQHKKIMYRPVFNNSPGGL